jgi:tetratricopeptide (TPR) repeat protein
MTPDGSIHGTGRRQPQRLPPPITWGASALDGGLILEEFPDDLGLVLWKTARSVHLWAELPHSERAEAFAPSAFQGRIRFLKQAVPDTGLRRLLESASDVLRGVAVDTVGIAAACRRLAEWADEGGKLATALEFMQAAAFVRPEDADLPLAVAKLARRSAEYARAETWYRQAISTARRTRNRSAFARAYLGLGITHRQRGAYPAARNALLRSLRAARRHSLREVVAMAYHELAGIGIRTSNASEVRRYTRAALEAYGPGNPGLTALAHDVAVFWMKLGYFPAALRVFSAIPASYGGATEQLALHANRVRAAGAVGDRDLFEDSWAEADQFILRADTAQTAADALVSMTRGAQSIGDWSRAEEAGRRARELAKQRGEFEQLAEADALLEAITGRRRIVTSAEMPSTTASESFDSLAMQLAEAKTAGAGA